MTNNRRTSFKAFSLTELLVVITVMLIIAAILFPALSQARAKAQVVICVNNQRQILIGGLNYSKENDQAVLFSNWLSHEKSANDYKGPGWLYTWSKRGRSWDEDDVKTSAIWPYVGTKEIFRCPSHTTNIGSGTRKLTSYMINGVTTDYGYKSRAPLEERHFFKLHQFNPYQVYFMESNPDGPSGMWNDGSNFPVERGTANGVTQLTNRHFGRAQVGFFDGHIESIPDERYLDMLGRPGELWACPIKSHKGK